MVDWILIIIFLSIMFLFAILAIFSPMTIMKIQALGYTLLYTKLFGEDEHYNKMAHLIKEDPQAYALRFKRFLLMLRVGGVAGLLVFMLALYELVLA